MAKYDFIYNEKFCPISYTNIDELRDPVVFNHRVYSKKSLTDWYITRFNRGETTLQDIFTQRVLPPVTIPKTRFEAILASIPTLSETECWVLRAVLFIAAAYVRKPISQLVERDYISADTCALLIMLKSVIHFLFLLLMVLSGYKQRSPQRNNAANNEIAIKAWLADQIEEYDPLIHKVKDAVAIEDQADEQKTALLR